MTLDGLAPDAAEIESAERVKPPRPGRNETVPIDRIIFGERRRQEMGDIDALAGSIGRYGLLQPIVVDDEWRLVAGGRRLEACRRLGWRAIPARLFSALSEEERREIELEENLQRKDLTPFEQARELVRKAPVVADAIAGSLPTKVTRGEPRQMAAPKEDVAQALGTSRRELDRAEQHVATAEDFPFMQQPDWKQYHVLEAREHLQQMPAGIQEAAAAMMGETGVPPKTAIEMARNVASMPVEKQERVRELYRSEDSRDRSLAKTMAVQLPPSPDQRAVLLPEAVRVLRQCAKLHQDDFATELQGVAARVEELRKQIIAAHAERVKGND